MASRTEYSASGSASSAGAALLKGLAYLLLLVLTIVSLYPLGVMILNSFKTDSEINYNSAGLPLHWTVDNYGRIFAAQGGLVGNFLSGIFVATSITVVSVFLSAMAAFAFAKYRFAGRDLIFACLLATLMIPSEITIPPLYLIFAKIGWVNTYQGMIAPGLVSVFGLFMLRQYMLSVPGEVLDAARLDGAGHWRLFWSIMLPLAQPAIAALCIIQFLGAWNSYLWPIIIAPDQSIQPIMAVLPTLTDPRVGFLPVWSTIMTGCVLATIPILIVFLIFQDKFIAGTLTGSMK